MLEKDFAKLFLKELKKRSISSKDEVDKLKKELCIKYGLKESPTNPDILKYATKKQLEQFSKIMGIKPTRTISGVATITVSCKPGYCGGRCTYCPPLSKLVPKSYSANEPAI
ncbi:MAG: tRNA uridine(34) 5-carboxymethylaminomethyl modification radical SAM/GNAT enzyme Elp3, partial [Candidatus Aenigmarchaeota archaeon]|nr:tRNA uridine(34) 5-carboxymethylaminomethyl modification radical SAM/GNAT enzyme Elp3 [Candidatus Aenigmarchaeota archaeon]